MSQSQNVDYDYYHVHRLLTSNKLPGKEELANINASFQQGDDPYNIDQGAKLVVQMWAPFVIRSKTGYTQEERVNVKEELSTLGREITKLFCYLYAAAYKGDNSESLHDMQEVLVDLTSALEHKTVVMLWKEILKHTGSPSVLHVLGKTIQILYLTRVKEVNYFKLCKFLCIAFLKYVGTVAEQDVINVACTSLLTSVYRTTETTDNVTHFFTTLKTNLHNVVELDGQLQSLDLGTLLHLLQSPQPVVWRDVFSCLRNCAGDVARGLLLTDQQNTPLISYTIYCLCSVVTTCSVDELGVVEGVLVENVLCDSMVCSLVATDVAVFLARMAPPALVLHQVKFYLRTLSVVREYQTSAVRLLLTRLLPLVEPDQLNTLNSQYISAQHPQALSVFQPSQVQRVCKECSVKWDKNILKSDVYSQTLLVSASVEQFSELTSQLLSSASTEVLDVCYNLVTNSLKGLTSSWKQLDTTSKMCVLKQAVYLVKLEDPLISGLVLGILAQCAKEQYSIPEYSATVTQLLTALYHQNKWSTVVVAARLAQVTPHKEILVGIAKDPLIKQAVSEYLSPAWSPRGAIEGPDPPLADLETVYQLPSRSEVKGVLSRLKAVGRLPKYCHSEVTQLVSIAVRQ